MIHRIQNIIIVSIVTTLSLCAQEDIKNFTITLIDTLDSEYKQTQEIYNWISSNIKYDVKKYKKFDNSLISAPELLDKRKGTCSDYANLFKEMCESVGIEAYSIHGYSKGYSYYAGMPFLRGNHTWNVIRADTGWVICDPTWGSGYMTHKPGFWKKFIYMTTGTAFTNNKTVFEQKIRNNYFDISKEDITKTHYPLDPKWLFSKYPVSFGYYNGDSTDKNFDLPYYSERIEEIRGKSENQQLKVEGTNALKYNPLNHFNIAHGYLKTASLYNIERDINKDNLWQFEKYQAEFNLIYESISKHKVITDSVYRSRFRSLKNLASDQKRLTNKIISKTKSAKKSFQSKQKQITGKSSSYDKKLGGYIVNIGRSELKYLNPDGLYTETNIDSATLNELKNEISILEEEETFYNLTLDSLLSEVGFKIIEDSYLDDSIITKNTIFNKDVVSLENMILTGNEVTIRYYVDSLKSVYSEIVIFLNNKKNSKKEVEATGRLHYSSSAELQKNLKQQVTLLNKAARASNYNNEILKSNNLAVKRLINSYNNSIEFTRILQRHNNSQKDIRKQNLEALKEQRKNIKKEYKFFLAWYNHIYKSEKAKYENEKIVMKAIQSISQKNRKLVEMKIKKYNTTQNTR